ncbi:NAD(P)/FAD-dependent oxidoreductase [Candidatus Izemoplasma sp. B36]|uniref:NAD(P)/FAD-dependent oxidoreductase n=1 Tax=Candidatus Izemoplasma sp. B36 TaxID=3242468 RepID=UPI003557B942
MNKANIVIIGAGISGLSAAYNLAKKGMNDIVVIDKSYITSGSTGRCGAGVRQQWGTKLNCILAKKSIEFFTTAKEELDYDKDIEFKQEGYLILSTSKEEDEVFKNNVKIQNFIGIPSKLLTVDEALKIVPHLNRDSFTSASFCKTDGHVNPFLMSEAYYLAAKKLGVKFYFYEAVKEIIVKENKIQKVITDKHEFITDKVINAAGGFSHEVGEMVGVDIPTFSENHEILVTEPTKPMQGPMVMSFSKNIYCQQVPHGSFLMGRSNPSAKHDHDISSSWQFLDEMAKTVCHILPEVGKLRVVRTWGGSYNVSPDHQPIISDIEALPGFYVACGYSGHGFMFAPITGILLSQMILNEKLEDYAKDLNIKRFENKTITDFEKSVV